MKGTSGMELAERRNLRIVTAESLESGVAAVICLVGIKGDVSLVGAKVADELRFSGRGRLSGKMGACPFCVKFGKSFTMEYKNDRWSYDL